MLKVYNVFISGPVMRPTVKAKEERKWVLDTINQYFDVIVEEDDEEESDDDEDCDSDESIESLSEYEDEEEMDDDEEIQGYKSTNRIRSMLTRAAANVSNSQSNLASINKLKQNLGSRISLGGIRQSVENLSNL